MHDCYLSLLPLLNQFQLPLKNLKIIFWLFYFIVDFNLRNGGGIWWWMARIWFRVDWGVVLILRSWNRIWVGWISSLVWRMIQRRLGWVKFRRRRLLYCRWFRRWSGNVAWTSERPKSLFLKVRSDLAICTGDVNIHTPLKNIRRIQKSRTRCLIVFNTISIV